MMILISKEFFGLDLNASLIALYKYATEERSLLSYPKYQGNLVTYETSPIPLFYKNITFFLYKSMYNKIFQSFRMLFLLNKSKIALSSFAR